MVAAAVVVAVVVVANVMGKGDYDLARFLPPVKPDFLMVLNGLVGPKKIGENN